MNVFSEQESPQQQKKQNKTTQAVAEATFYNSLDIRKTRIWLIWEEDKIEHTKSSTQQWTEGLQWVENLTNLANLRRFLHCNEMPACWRAAGSLALVGGAWLKNPCGWSLKIHHLTSPWHFSVLGIDTGIDTAKPGPASLPCGFARFQPLKLRARKQKFTFVKLCFPALTFTCCTESIRAHLSLRI